MHNGGHGSALSKNKPAGAPLRKGAWMPEEDLLLRRCIEKYGEGKWHQVPQRAGLTRCRKSCRLRWLNYLRPNLKRGDFAEDEIDLILRLHRLLGNKWSLIAGRIPGRTANDIKNYWNTRFNKTHAANSSVGTKAAGENGSADGGFCKKVAESTHSKSYNKNTTMPNAFPAAARTQNKATTTTFTVIRPEARAVTASIRLAITPATETKGAGGLAAHCSCPAPTGSGGDVHFPESSISPTPLTSDDEITVWWDSVLEGLVMGSDEQMSGSGSRGDPSA